MTPVRLAIVGCGAIAELGHLPAAARAPEVEITLLVDRDADRARYLADRFGIARTSTDLAEVADHAEAACIALPHHLHRPVTETLVGQGVHVLIEKPLATSIADCEAMVDAAGRAQRVLAVAMARRFCPSSRFLKQIVDSGMLGEIERFEVVSGVGDSWPAQSLYLLRAAESGGGVLMANGCHDLDILTWLLGPVGPLDCRIDSAFGLEGNCRIDCTMESGATGSVELSRTRTLANLIRLEGKKGSVEAPLMGDSVSITPVGGTAILNGRAATTPFDFAQVMADQLADFAAAVRGERAPLVDGGVGRDIVALIERCYASARPMELPWQRPVAIPVAA